MSKVKLNLRSLSPTQKVAKAKQLITTLTGNPQFTTPHPPLAQINSAAEALELLIAETQQIRQMATIKTSMLHDKEGELVSLLRQLAAYIESIGGEDDTKILSAGVSLRGQPGAPAEMVAPTGLSARQGNHEGEVELSWEKVKIARGYVIERSVDPSTQTSWTHQSFAAKPFTTVGGLSSGTRYWFRVATLTVKGQSGWSDPSSKIAP